MQYYNWSEMKSLSLACLILRKALLFDQLILPLSLWVCYLIYLSLGFLAYKTGTDNNPQLLGLCEE